MLRDFVVNRINTPEIINSSIKEHETKEVDINLSIAVIEKGYHLVFIAYFLVKIH